MATDLKLAGYDYNVAAAVFFLLYAAAEIPRSAKSRERNPAECTNLKGDIHIVTSP